MLLDRGLCNRSITRPEESYRLWRVIVCDQQTLKNEEAKAFYWAVENTTTMGCNAKKTNKHNLKLLQQLNSTELTEASSCQMAELSDVPASPRKIC
jgi:hypothetical protein